MAGEIPRGMKLEMFPQEYIDLNREISFHPVLMHLLAVQPVDEFEIRLAQVASYCEVMLDDTYTYEDLKGIAKVCCERLMQKRGKVLLENGEFYKSEDAPIETNQPIDVEFKMKDDDSIEKEIQAKGLTAPRLTPKDIIDSIVSEQYYIFPGTVVTVCCLTLKNGFNVIGEAAPVSSDNFDVEIGEEIAYEKAKEKIWALEGYLLKEKLYQIYNTAQNNS